MFSLSSLDVLTPPHSQETKASGKNYGPHFPFPPWLLPVIYRWCQGVCFISSQLPLWSSARQLLDSRMAPKLLSVPPKESSSFLLDPWSPWKKVKHNRLPPLCLMKLERGKRSNPPVACEHGQVWGFPSRLALALRMPDAQFCVRVQIFLSGTFHLWGPSFVPSDITEHDCPLPSNDSLSVTSRQRIHILLSILWAKQAHSPQCSTVGKSIVLFTVRAII